MNCVVQIVITIPIRLTFNTRISNGKTKKYSNGKKIERFVNNNTKDRLIFGGEYNTMQSSW